MKFLTTFIFSFLILSHASFSQLKLEYSGIGKLDMAAFKINAGTNISITGESAALRGFSDGKGNTWWGGKLYAYGWILNSDTREVVWHQLEKIRSKSKKPRGLFSFKDEVRLDAGGYEVYFTAMFDFNDGDNSNWFSRVFSSDIGDYDEHDLEKTYLSLSTASGSLTKIDASSAADNFSKNAVVNFIRVGDNRTYKKAFSLSDELELNIYTIGEARERSSFDYVWIYNLNDYKKVWSLDYKDAGHAGGADKNVMVKDKIKLPKGSYIIYYNTDDSHSFDRWNSLPPDDPQFWGVTIWPVSDKDKSKISVLTGFADSKPVIDLTKIKDDQLSSQGFSVSSDIKLNVMCIGEASSKRLADYGWIVNADTREKIWEMNAEKSSHAGGAEKNRMNNEEVFFKEGNYIAYFKTDGSHSYEDWNAAPPFDKELWGLSIRVLNEPDKNKISQFDAAKYKSKDVVAEIIRVRDDEYLNESFSLNNDTKLRIYAVGEGSGGRMFDYAWIKNEDTGRIVWEMTFKNTSHAGGASKNRLFNDVVILQKGKYRLFYESDDSHSYGGWNSTPPSEQEKYGVTVMFTK